MDDVVLNQDLDIFRAFELAIGLQLLDMSYRHSRFRSTRRVQFDEHGYPLVAPRHLIEPPEIIMQLGVRLHREDPQQLRSIIDQYKHHRKKTQPPQQSAGSVFKNPAGDYAGRLIEAAGLKGMASGVMPTLLLM